MISVMLDNLPNISGKSNTEFNEPITKDQFLAKFPLAESDSYEMTLYPDFTNIENITKHASAFTFKSINSVIKLYDIRGKFIYKYHFKCNGYNFDFSQYYINQVILTGRMVTHQYTSKLDKNNTYIDIFYEDNSYGTRPLLDGYDEGTDTNISGYTLYSKKLIKDIIIYITNENLY